MFGNAAKNVFGRQRPFQVDPNVRALFTDETDRGYPSGHATRGMVMALVLAELCPEKREELLARGRLIGWHRAMAGVHFPSDVQGGRVLGQAVASALLADGRVLCMGPAPK